MLSVLNGEWWAHRMGIRIRLPNLALKTRSSRQYVKLLFLSMVHDFEKSTGKCRMLRVSTFPGWALPLLLLLSLSLSPYINNTWTLIKVHKNSLLERLVKSLLANILVLLTCLLPLSINLGIRVQSTEHHTGARFPCASQASAKRRRCTWPLRHLLSAYQEIDININYKTNKPHNKYSRKSKIIITKIMKNLFLKKLLKYLQIWKMFLPLVKNII